MKVEHEIYCRVLSIAQIVLPADEVCGKGRDEAAG
jgi:hypothetical protein